MKSEPFRRIVFNVYILFYTCSLSIHSQLQKQSDLSRNKKVGNSHKKPLIHQVEDEEDYEVIQHDQPRLKRNKGSTLPPPPRTTSQQTRITRTLPYRGAVVEEESYVDIRPRP